MRIPRKRVFQITVAGREQWTEEAEGRTVLETQHHLATETYKGMSVRVREQYLGGARTKPVLDEEDDSQQANPRPRKPYIIVSGGQRR